MEYDLQDLRKSLDNIDSALVYLLAERFRITHNVGIYKKAQALPPVDEAREAEQFARIDALAKQAGLDPLFAAKMLRCIIDAVVAEHKKIAAS